jgi:hypothetical protein
MLPESPNNIGYNSDVNSPRPNDIGLRLRQLNVERAGLQFGDAFQQLINNTNMVFFSLHESTTTMFLLQFGDALLTV